MENEQVGGNYLRSSENVLCIFKASYGLTTLFSLLLLLHLISKCVTSPFLVITHLSVVTSRFSNRVKLFFGILNGRTMEVVLDYSLGSRGEAGVGRSKEEGVILRLDNLNKGYGGVRK